MNLLHEGAQRFRSKGLMQAQWTVSRHDFYYGPHIFSTEGTKILHIVGICVYDSNISIQMEMRGHRAMSANKELLEMYVQYMQERGPFVTLGMNSVSSGTASYSQSHETNCGRICLHTSLILTVGPVGKGLIKTRTGPVSFIWGHDHGFAFRSDTILHRISVEMKMMSCEAWGASAWIIDNKLGCLLACLLASNHAEIVFRAFSRRTSQSSRKRHYGSFGAKSINTDSQSQAMVGGGAPHNALC